jgi:hypothetical protein
LLGSVANIDKANSSVQGILLLISAGYWYATAHSFNMTAPLPAWPLLRYASHALRSAQHTTMLQPAVLLTWFRAVQHHSVQPPRAAAVHLCAALAVLRL